MIACSLNDSVKDVIEIATSELFESIEVQFNTLYDRQINNWLHAYVYKKGYQNEVGEKMREEYEQGRVRNVDEFEEVLKDVLHSC